MYFQPRWYTNMCSPSLFPVALPPQKSISSTNWIRVWLPSWGPAISRKKHLFQLRSVFEQRSAVFWNITQRMVVKPCQRFGTTYQFHFQGSWNPRISWPSNMWPIGCPETSVRNYYYMLRNITEERRYHLLRCRSPKSRTVFELPYKSTLTCETENNTKNDCDFGSEHYTNTTTRTMVMGTDITVGWHLFRKLLQLIRDTNTHTHTHTEQSLQNALYTSNIKLDFLPKLQLSFATLPTYKHLTNCCMLSSG
jgi:hypothetical protein